MNGIDPLDPRILLSSDEDEDDEALSLPSAGVANVRGEISESEDEGEDVDIGEFDWRDADQEVIAELGEDAFYTDDSDNDRSYLPECRLILV